MKCSICNTEAKSCFWHFSVIPCCSTDCRELSKRAFSDLAALRGILGITYTQSEVDSMLKDNQAKTIDAAREAVQNAGGINTDYHVESITRKFY